VITWLIPAAVLAVLLLWVVGARSRLRQLRRHVHHAFEAIEPVLHQQHELACRLAADATPVLRPRHGDALTDLAAVCDRAESATEALRLRPLAFNAVQALGQVQAELARALATLEFALATTPGAPSSLAALQGELRDAQEALLDHAKTYNEAVGAHNRALREVPTAWLGLALRWRPLRELDLGPRPVR
jgi:hypothetical protein